MESANDELGGIVGLTVDEVGEIVGLKVTARYVARIE